VDQGPRYAVFFVPPAPSDLYRFGSSVLGYDCYTGAKVAPPAEFKSDAASWRKATEEPRRYGFHATLKAPFHLSPSCTEVQLISAVQSFVSLGYAAPVITPAVKIFSGFAAIVALKPEPMLAALAGACTTIFDAYRAPMSPQERARRIALGLNQGEIQSLGRWGYPFGFSNFEFHMTLTGKVQASRRKETVAVLRKCFSRMHGNQEITVDRIALVKQESSRASFRVISQVELRGAR
jgi:hypothetical protein